MTSLLPGTRARRPAGAEARRPPAPDLAPAIPGFGSERAPRGPSIAVRLVGLVLVALVPTTLVVAGLAQSWRSASDDDAADSVRAIATAAAVQQESLVASTALLLEALALTPAVTDATTCPTTMADISSQRAQFAVMGVADAGGDFWCSSEPLPEPVTVRDRDYFVRARSTGEPTVGSYQIGRVTGKPTVALAHPILDRSGAFVGAVIASIDLSRPALLAERLDLPDGSTVTVFDRDGTVLMRWPGEGYVGDPVPRDYRSLQRGSERRFPGLDGVERIYGIAPITSGSDDISLVVGVPIEEVQSAVSASLRTATWRVASIAVLVGALAIAVGRLTVVRPIRRLQRSVRQIARGDLSAVASFSGGGELSELASDVDGMALALQERQAELRLAEQRAVEQRYVGLLDIAADAVIVHDPAGRIVLFNKGAEAMFDTTADAVRGRPHAEVLGSVVVPGSSTTVTWTGPDGTTRWAEAHASQGKDGLTTLIVREVTDSHRALEAEAGVRERDRRFRLAQAHSAIGMALVGLDGRWLDVNPALCQMVDRSEEELLELSFQDITHPDDLEADLEQVARLLAGEISGYQMEKRYLRADGSVVWVQLNGTLVRADDGEPRYFVAQVQDVTDAREMLADLERQRQELERSNAELEQFAYVASHDLSEPLRSISGFAALLEEDLGPRLAGEQREYLQFMLDGTSRMQALIDDLLAFSRVRRSAVEFGTVDLSGAVDGVVTALSGRVAEARASIDVGVLPPVQANETLMTQLFQNLLSNALKFRRDEVDAIVQVRAEASSDGRVEVVVEDNGIGIDAKYRDRVFRMFQRLHTRDAFEGTGMGLAVCAKIVETLGGTIWIEDSPLGGAAFHFTLPLAEEGP